MKFSIFFLLTVTFLSTLEGTFVCDGCIAFVDELKQLLDKNEDNIINEVANLCDKITFGKEPYDSLCRKFVIYEVNETIKTIQEYGNSTVICQQLHLCRVNSGISSYSSTISDKVVIFIKIYLLTNILKTIIVCTNQ